MRKNLIHIILALSLIFSFQKTKAQLSGVLTVPGTYTSLAAAINDLNFQGVNGPTTVNIASGYKENAPNGGYTLTVTGSATNPIIFQKNGIGADPMIISYTTGIGTGGSAIQDGMFRILGSDYITFDGIELRDTNTTNPKTMEFGFCFFKKNATDGCQYNTVKNCVIKMRTINNFGGWYVDGSRGIEVVNATYTAQVTPLTTTSSAGSNSNNKLYNNTIKNCYTSISLLGFNDSSPFTFADRNNDIGGNSISTGNRVLNFGGVGSSSLTGIQTYYQRDANISYNIINNNDGSNVDHLGTIKGIMTGTAQSANVTISNNTITLKGSTGIQSLTAIENHTGHSPITSNTIDISNNLITGCTTPTIGGSGPSHGIHNKANADVLNISGNSFINNSTSATTGSYSCINNTGTIVSVMKIDNNLINGITIPNSAIGYWIKVINQPIYIPSCNLSISGNTLQSVTMNSAWNSDLIFISAPTTASTTTISYNNLGTQTLSNTGKLYFIDNSNSMSPNSLTTISYNTISGNIYNTGTANFIGYLNSGGVPSASIIINNNNFSNYYGSSSSYAYGIQIVNLNGGMQTVRSNTISNLNGSDPIYGIGMGYGIPGSSIDDNKVNNLNGPGQVFGVDFGYWNAVGVQVKSNIINSLTGGTNVFGMNSKFANSCDILKNKIYDLKTNSSYSQVTGLYLGGNVNGTLTIANNLIGDIKQPASNCNTCVVGVDLQAYYSNMHINFIHNTIYLNATATGTTFGCFALNTVSGAASGDEYFFKNNIIINNSTAIGTGSVVAFQRAYLAFWNYNLSSNNNIFYAGTPGPSNLLFSDGTNTFSTMPAFKTFVSPRESNSGTELAPFTTTVGAMSNYLNLNTSTPTLAESGGMAGTGITDDYVGTLRNVSTPDIGAWEGNFMIPLSIPKNSNDSYSIQLYPNPTSGDLILKTDIKENLSFEIYNTLGQIILQKKITDSKTKINLSEQANGVYFVKVIENRKSVYNSKIIKE